MAKHAREAESSQVRTREYHDDRPATEGQTVRPIDKALLGGAPQRVGRFDYHYGSDTWT